MAENEEGAAEETDQPEEKPKKSKKMIIIIGAAVLVLLLGGGGAFFMMSGGSDTPTDGAESGDGEGSGAADEGDGAEKGDGKEENNESGESGAEGGDKKSEAADESAEITFGATYPLKAFTINLGNPLENRFINFSVSLEYKGGEPQKAELEARKIQIRDAIISVTRRKTREFLLGPDGLDQLRLELLNRINQFLDKKINAVFIVDILIE